MKNFPALTAYTGQAAASPVMKRRTPQTLSRYRPDENNNEPLRNTRPPLRGWRTVAAEKADPKCMNE
jgi:hypothetical protein